MDDVSTDQWQKEMEEARTLLKERFNPLHCLRCKADDFFVRMWPDESLVPGLADSKSNRVVELICQNCGFQEKHVVRLLTDGQNAKRKNDA